MKNFHLTTAAKLALFIYFVTIAYFIGNIVYLQNLKARCNELSMDGYTNIPRTSPKYDSELDRDGDGIACET